MDLKDLKKIGLAKELDSLYYLEAQRNNNVGLVSSVFVNKKSDKNVLVPPRVLWQLRLGHLSHDRMECMNKMYGYVPTSVHTTCDVCQQSR